MARGTRGAQRDPRTEQALETKGVAFAFVHDPVSLSDIDLDKSLANQGRIFEPFDDATVERYVEALKRGDVFPPVVLHKRSRGKAIVIDGNHRVLAAQRAGLSSWPHGVYEVSADAKTIAVLTMEANTKHGRPTDVAERVVQAIYLIDSGATKAQASASLNVSVREIDKELAKVKQERRAVEAGVPMSTWSRISAQTRARLATVNTDEGLVAVADLVARANLTFPQVQEVVTAVNTVQSATKQRAIVKDFAAQYAEQIQATAGGVLSSQTSKRAQTPRQLFATSLGMLGRLPEDLTALAGMFAPAEREEAAERIRHEVERLTALAEKLTVS